MVDRLGRGLRAIVLAVCAIMLVQAAPTPALAEEASPFDQLAGRWVGEGRFGIRDGSTEAVKCRVTYILGNSGHELRQTIRCASAGGNVEIQSVVTHNSGAISGIWRELVRDMSGEVSGNVTPKGFRVAVRGGSLNANMDIIMTGGKQVIEIQVIDSSLIGLTLILEKADAPAKGPT
jgi:hypothetical protein